MIEAKALRESSKLVVGGEEAIVYGVFYTKVRNGGEWDYKQRGPQYEEVGNFNYGATGRAAGIPEQVLLRAAGAAQGIAGTSMEDFGKWWAGSPYGDDKVDQVWIKAGIEFAKAKGF
ncbi:bacteriocin [Pseudomonas sp. CCM 7893]|uniref:Bacteriocin n=2 Tax=Pseudomonas spelaei TaxID=1055469 RepID=A0A6I3WLM2_9PSED|nr:polymorphic toxin type 44 domain-containing protein [Pseudomonas spelaei]MUF07216.1 bacteriocin [Pseudomonas spelaei]